MASGGSRVVAINQKMGQPIRDLETGGVEDFIVTKQGIGSSKFSKTGVTLVNCSLSIQLSFSLSLSLQILNLGNRMVVPRGGHDECGGTRCVFTFVMIGWRWTDPHYCYIINLITPLGSFIIAIRVAIAPLLTSRHDSTQFLCFFFLFSSSIFSFSLSLSLGRRWHGRNSEKKQQANVEELIAKKTR